MNGQKTRTFTRSTNGTPSAFLAERIRDNSNLELEWLWAAQQVSDLNERRYCLERALTINPNNAETRRTLRKFAPQPTPAEAPASVEIKRIPLLGS